MTELRDIWVEIKRLWSPNYDDFDRSRLSDENQEWRSEQ